MNNKEYDESVIRSALEPASPGVVMLDRPLNYLSHAAFYRRCDGQSLVWVNYLRTIESWDDAEQTLRAAFHCYNGGATGGPLAWLRAPEYLPPGACILYFSRMEHFAESSPQEYRRLIELLQAAAEHWRENNYCLRSLIWPGADRPSSRRAFKGLTVFMRQLRACLAHVHDAPPAAGRGAQQ